MANKYLVNKSFMSVQAEGITVPRNKYVPVSEAQAERFLAQSWIKDLSDHGLITLEDKIPANMLTQAEQLASVSVQLTAVAKDRDAIKQQALAEIAKRDQEIASLKAKLAAAGIQ